LTVKLVWIPSHIGLYGNERADGLAKSALSMPNVEVDIPAEPGTLHQKIEDRAYKKWQKQWDDGILSHHYRRLEPKVGNRVKLTVKPRAKEVLFTRLRLGKCRLNAYLHKIGCHTDGLCSVCSVPETIEHYVLHCTANRDLGAQIKTELLRNNQAVTLRNTLMSTNCLNLVYDQVSASDRKL